MNPRTEQAVRELAEALLAELRASPPPAPLPDRLMSVEAAAQALSIGRTLAFREIRAGRLRSVKVGRRRLVPSSALDAYSYDAN